MIKELREKLAKAIERMDALLNTADAEKRNLNEAEEKEFSDLDASLPVIKADIARREKLEDDKVTMSQSRRSIPIPAATHRAEDPTEFKSLAEYLCVVTYNKSDKRLESLYNERAQSMGSGEMGGWAIPPKFRDQLMMVQPQDAIFRPRATVLPAGYPPDQAVSMPTLDQTATHDVYGGVSVSWIAEGGTKVETDMHLKQVTLTPYEVAGHIVTTEKLLRNWASAESILTTMLRKAIIGAEETAFLTGNGVSKPTGITVTGARIDYTRATASTIVWADIAGMFARLKMGGSPVWIASQTCIPQLVNIRDTGNFNIWQTSAIPGLPATLFGYPVLFHDRSPALGTTGDLVLADLSYYLIQDGSGPYVMASDGYYFTSNKIIIKAFWNVDGKPWLSGPLPLEGSASNTVSPFVILNAA